VRTGVALDSSRGARGGRMRGDSSARGGNGGGTGGPGGAGAGAFAGAGGGASGGRGRSGGPSIVFVKKGETFEPRVVRTGINNFEYIEVRGGVQEGEQVALLAAAALQARREQQNERFRGMAGGPLGPGSGQQKGGAGGGARSGGATR
jgi:hypothetical protein